MGHAEWVLGWTSVKAMVCRRMRVNRDGPVSMAVGTVLSTAPTDAFAAGQTPRSAHKALRTVQALAPRKPARQNQGCAQHVWSKDHYSVGPSRISLCMWRMVEGRDPQASIWFDVPPPPDTRITEYVMAIQRAGDSSRMDRYADSS